MARMPRRKSSNGIYHVMLRGINRQTIFEEDGDRLRLLDTLKKYKDISNYNLYSYCLMDNHIHLLLKENDESISKVIQRISSSYVHWYNNKYDRSGPLFGGRFRSENVETMRYFITVLRYIHQNPVKAGLASNAFECRWTSIHEYFGQNALVDVDFALDLISPHREESKKIFTKYMLEVSDDKCLDDHVKVKISDDEVKTYLYEIGFPNNSSLQQMEKEKRDTIIMELKGLNGVSIRQLARITGVSKNIISRVWARSSGSRGGARGT